MLSALRIHQAQSRSQSSQAALLFHPTGVSFVRVGKDWG